jgi:type I restriction enzyme S subunit
VKRFSEVVAPQHKRIAANNEESCTLASLRDTLLPKLISGELRVKDAEGFVSEVV